MSWRQDNAGARRARRRGRKSGMAHPAGRFVQEGHRREEHPVKVTVLGTGIMGTGITHSLLRAGHDVTVWNRTAERARPLEADGAPVAATSGAATATAAAVLDRVHPVLAAIGARQVRVGPQVGQATALKLACNAWVAVLTAGTAQSMALAGHLGLDPTTFLEAITGAPIDSAYARIKGTAMAEGAFAPSFAVDALAKDLGLMLDAAHASRMPTTLLDPLLSLFTSVSEAGRGGEVVARGLVA